MKILAWYVLIITIFRIGVSVTSEDKPGWRIIGILVDVPPLIFTLKYLGFI